MDTSDSSNDAGSDDAGSGDAGSDDAGSGDAGVTDRPPPPAAAAIVVGLGAAGRQVAQRLQLRLADDPLTRRGGLAFLLPEPDAASVSEAVQQSVRAHMQQGEVSRLEAGFGTRRPAHRYLKLHLVYVGALAEMTDDLLPACLRAVAALDHPPPGLETLFLLDATEPADATAPPADAPDPPADAPDPEPPPSRDLTRLREMEQGLQELAEGQRREWGAAGRSRVLLAHPHRADGSWLAPPEELAKALAGLLAGHLAPGVLHDSLADFSEAGTPAFALCGGAGALLPREAILGRAADLLAADILEQTEAGGGGPPETLIAGDAPEVWEAWREVQEGLLTRRSLLKRLLGPNGSGVVVAAEEEAVYAGDRVPPRWSLVRELRTLFWGEGRPAHSSGGLRVRLSLPSPRWQAGDPHHWPEELARLDAEGAAALNAWLAAAPDSIPPVAGQIAQALSRCVDHCVRRHVGGTAAALAMLEAASRSVRGGIREAGGTPFAEPLLPDDIGLPPGTTFAEAWDIFQARCRRIPDWRAALAAGAAWGALALSACFPFGLLLGVGWVGAGLGLLAGGAYYGRRLGNLKRMGDYLRQCLEAKNGRRLLEYAELAAGTPAHDGVYQAVLHFLETAEQPAVAQFSESRRARIAEARAPHSLPSLGGTDDYLLDLDAAQGLRDLLRRNLSDAHLADAARSLLRSDGLFDGWHAPDWDTTFTQVRRQARRDHLRAWEAPRKALGPFVRDLLPDPPSFARWVRTTLDRLAMRSMLLALRPPAHLERDNAGEEDAPPPLTTVRVAAPASLAWHAAQADPAGGQAVPPTGADVRRLPQGSAAADLADWHGGDLNACRAEADEADAVFCLVLTTGLSAAQALAAIRHAPAAAPVRVPADPRPLNGHSHINGKGNGSGPARSAAIPAPPGLPTEPDA